MKKSVTRNITYDKYGDQVVKYDVKWEPLQEGAVRQQSISPAIQSRQIYIPSEIRPPLARVNPSRESLLENNNRESIYPIEDPRNPFHHEYLNLQAKYLETMRNQSKSQGQLHNPEHLEKGKEGWKTPKYNRCLYVPDLQLDDEKTAKKNESRYSGKKEYQLEQDKENQRYCGSHVPSCNPFTQPLQASTIKHNKFNEIKLEESGLNLEELYQYQPPLIYNNETLILETDDNMGFRALYPDSRPAPLTGLQPQLRKISKF